MRRPAGHRFRCIAVLELRQPPIVTLSRESNGRGNGKSVAVIFFPRVLKCRKAKWTLLWPIGRARSRDKGSIGRRQKRARNRLSKVDKNFAGISDSALFGSYWYCSEAIKAEKSIFTVLFGVVKCKMQNWEKFRGLPRTTDNSL